MDDAAVKKLCKSIGMPKVMWDTESFRAELAKLMGVCVAAERDAVIAAQEELRLCQQDAIALQAEKERLREALLDVAATLAWQSFGECRSYSDLGHTGTILTPAEADDLARSVLRSNVGDEAGTTAPRT